MAAKMVMNMGFPLADVEMEYQALGPVMKFGWIAQEIQKVVLVDTERKWMILMTGTRVTRPKTMYEEFQVSQLTLLNHQM